MRVLVSIHHPAQAHFFRYIVSELEAQGHEVRVCVRDKEVATDLLEAFDIDHRVLARMADSYSLPGLLASQVGYLARLVREARRFDPDVITSIGGVEIAYVAPLAGARSVAFNDSEGMPVHDVSLPLVDVICTPRAYHRDFGSRHVRYDGYHELAYLHPDRFRPSADRLREAGLEPGEPYFVLRFVAWQANHDMGKQGLSPATKRELADSLSEHGAVYITSEADLPREFEQYRTPIPPELAHDLLAFADLYVGDSQTMTTEAALLGTPAVRSNSFVGDGDMSNFVELEERYELLYNRADDREALELVERLLADPTTEETWQRRRERLLADKIDVTEFAVDVIEQEGRKAPGDPPTGAAGRLRRRLSRSGAR
jgi:predicted glycosyltransferase